MILHPFYCTVFKTWRHCYTPALPVPAATFPMLTPHVAGAPGQAAQIQTETH